MYSAYICVKGGDDLRGELEKIIASDKHAREEMEQTLQRRLNLEGEISREKEDIVKELMERADAEANAEIAEIRSKAEKKWADDRIKYNRLRDNMEKMYAVNRDEWAINVSGRVVGGKK